MPTLEEPVSVFDLPNIYQKPAYEEILKALELLEIKPTSWGGPRERSTTPNQEAAISRYLMSIISSMFEWFDPEASGSMDKKELLWDLASKRVTERCGRSARGEMIRTWAIPSSSRIPELNFTIREPPLTGDNLGLKTWGTAFTISKKLETIGEQFFSHLIGKDSSQEEKDLQNATLRVLELGAGTGLVGIAAAAVWSTSVTLTDLEEIQGNLDFNIQANRDVVLSRGGTISGTVLDWKHPEEGLAKSPRTFDIIIAADSLYDEEHPQLVADMIERFLAKNDRSRALAAVPMRDAKTKAMAGSLRDCMSSKGLQLISQGWEICRDDWEEANDEEGVKCWWGIFGSCIQDEC